MGVNSKFIPFSKHDLVEMCNKGTLPSQGEADFRALVSLLASIYHYEFHQIVELIKQSYQPVTLSLTCANVKLWRRQLMIVFQATRDG